MSKKYLIGFIVGLITVGIMGYFVIGLSRAPQTTSQTIKIVATENFWGDIISQIGGSHVSVTSIISDPNADPHLYESNAKNALAVSQAKLVIENGLGYDDFMDKLMSASQNNSRDAIKVSSILGVSGNSVNPHLWYDIVNLPKITAVFEAELIKIDPSNRKTFEANTIKFNQSLQPIIDTINTIKSKYSNSPIAYTERVPEYLLIAAGLDIKSPVSFASAIEEGNDPSPADMITMKNLINNHQIKVLLYNAQVTSPTTQYIRDLATTAGIPVVGMTETMPANETFQSWQFNQAQALLKALGN